MKTAWNRHILHMPMDWMKEYYHALFRGSSMELDGFHISRLCIHQTIITKGEKLKIWLGVTPNGKTFIFFFWNERFIALINIRTYMTVTKLFRKYNQLTTVS
jgi:hypothetical protein